jgi:hypothetical protein
VPSTGYTLSGATPIVYINEELLPSSDYFWVSSTGSLTIPSTMINGDIRVELVAQKASFVISASPSSNGSYEVNSSAVYQSMVGISVFPDQGYELDSIEIAGEDISSHDSIFNELSGKYEFVMPGTNLNISVTFAPLAYTISYLDEGGEGLNGSYWVANTNPNYNSLVTVSTSANPGYQVDYVSYTTESTTTITVPYDSGYTFNMPSEDITLMVVFKPVVYTITVDPDLENGTISVSTSTASMGDSIHIVIYPDAGYLFSFVTYNDGTSHNIMNSPTYYTRLLTMPASNITISTEFTQESYNLGKADTTNGSFIITNGSTEITSAHYGDTVYVVPTPNEGYSVNYVLLSYATFTTIPYAGSYSFTMPNHQLTVYVSFIKDVYEVSANSTTNG